MAVVLRHIEMTAPRMDEVKLSAGVAIVARCRAAPAGWYFPLSVCFLHEFFRLLLKGHERLPVLYLNIVSKPTSGYADATATHLG